MESIVPRAPLPETDWTPQEHWVWEQVAKGDIADFNEREENVCPLPQQPEAWQDDRLLRPAFLLTILLHEPYRSAVPHQGVRIAGAWVKEAVDLSHATLACQLWLDRCRFESEANLSALRSSGNVSFGGSVFVYTLALNGVQIEGQLNLVESNVSRALNMNSLRVGQHLFMDGGATFAEVELVGAQIEGQLSLRKSTVNGTLDMEGLRVDGSLLMDGGNFVKDHSTRAIDLKFASIDLNFGLSGANLPSLDMTGTTIKGELRLTQGDSVPTWQRCAQLTLRNTKVGAIQEGPTAWPDTLELGGFTYDRLGGLGAENTNDMAARPVSWFKAWLGKQEAYAPQPYEQLASVLQQAGHKDKATAILYASKQRERKENTRWCSPAWWWLTLQWLFIGYGYHNFLVVPWVVFFCAVGTIILCWSGQGPASKPISEIAANTDKTVFLTYFTPLPRRCCWSGGSPTSTLSDNIAYSLDRLLPIIQLQKTHEDVKLPRGIRWYFYFHHFMGYVLASFLIAGLAGLTKK